MRPSPRLLEQERVKSQGSVARLCRGDRHFRFELVVAELFDAVTPVHERSPGA